MDYEKMYKEALERVRRLHDRMLFLSSTDALVASNELEFIFPELRESEDERILRVISEAVITFFSDYANDFEDEDRDAALAWLEKQKKQKSELPLMDGDTDTYFDDLRNHLPAGSGLRKEYKEYVEDDPVFRKLTNRNVGFAIARHFYELGLKSK